MIHTLEIENFKSIKHMKQECKRINIFIGEPNTGKSNILETLGILSYGRYYNYSELKDFVRYERTSNLFYDENLAEAIELKYDSISLTLKFENGRFDGRSYLNQNMLVQFTGDHETLKLHGLQEQGKKALEPFKFYRFAVMKDFPLPDSQFLLPPTGKNLMTLLLTNKELKTTANQLFTNLGLGLNLRPQENKIEVLKRFEDITISYPYSLISDTLQRMIFFLAVVLSNKQSVLAFEEPESHAFPYYMKYLAELIALDSNGNQYFISTHNPYFLLPLLEKCPKGDLRIFLTYYENYETKIKPFSEQEMGEVFEIDVFSNLDRFLKQR